MNVAGVTRVSLVSRLKAKTASYIVYTSLSGVLFSTSLKASRHVATTAAILT
jgi:hypothetical protein